jgi:hypothetical protein
MPNLTLGNRGVLEAARNNRAALERARGLHQYAAQSVMYATDIHRRCRVLARDDDELRAKLQFIQENYVLDVVSTGHNLANGYV